MHDAGAASLAISLFTVSNGFKWVAAGPAIRILETAGITSSAALSVQFENYQRAIVGTGWQTDFEQEAMKEAKGRGQEVIALVDAPFSIEERFNKLGRDEMPDQIWTFDMLSTIRVRDFVGNIPIIQMSDPRVERIRNLRIAYSSIKPIHKNLYLTEPIRVDCGPKFLDSNAFFINFLTWFRHKNPHGTVTVRVHPADNQFDLALHLGHQTVKIEIDDESSFEESIAQSRSVFGTSSSGLALANKAGIRAISVVPLYSPRSLEIAGVKVERGNFSASV